MNYEDLDRVDFAQEFLCLQHDDILKTRVGTIFFFFELPFLGKPSIVMVFSAASGFPASEATARLDGYLAGAAREHTRIAVNNAGE